MQRYLEPELQPFTIGETETMNETDYLQKTSKILFSYSGRSISVPKGHAYCRNIASDEQDKANLVPTENSKITRIFVPGRYAGARQLPVHETHPETVPYL